MHTENMRVNYQSWNHIIR